MLGKKKINIGCERVMLMGPDRVFYLGLLGAPSSRNVGSVTVYASLKTPFRLSLDEHSWEEHHLAVVPPYLSHRIETDDQMICSIMLEPEAIDFSCFGWLEGAELSSSEQRSLRSRIHQGFAYLQSIGVGATVEGLNVDRLFFEKELDKKIIDSRIARVIEKIKLNPAYNYSAEECADKAELSFSRFLHLFRDEVGVTFRKFRAWKRARNLLYHVNRTGTLTDIALEIGYPDSTHFSHSIRQFYGLQPKEIFAGSRRLAILLQESAGIRCRRNMAA